MGAPIVLAGMPRAVCWWNCTEVGSIGTLAVELHCAGYVTDVVVPMTSGVGAAYVTGGAIVMAAGGGTKDGLRCTTGIMGIAGGGTYEGLFRITGIGGGTYEAVWPTTGCPICGSIGGGV